MKSFTLALFFALLSFCAYSQSVTITLIKSPCNEDGEVRIDFSNFTPPYVITYSHSGGYINDTLLADASIIVTNFDGGWFYATGYNNNGTSVSKTENFPYPFNVSMNVVNAVCPQLGTATATITGGTPPYNITWFDQSTNQIVGQANPISLGQGGYYANIVDAAGCVVNTGEKERDSLAIYLYPDPGFTYDIDIKEANCTNGSAKVTNIAGGIAPFTFEWSDGTNANEIINRSSGVYNLIVTDAQGCSNFKQEIFIKQSKIITVDFVQQPETCNNADGKLQAFASGGKTPYTYEWNGFPNNITNTLTSIPANNYSVVVRDADGCGGFGYVYFQSISPVFAQITSVTAATCNNSDGGTTIVAAGGTAPYSINWPHNNATDFTLTNLPEGTHYFAIIDAVGCKRTGSVYIYNNPFIESYFNVSNPTCDLPNGTITTNVYGGTLPYTYAWSNGGSTDKIDFLTKGHYTVTITDATGCSKSKSIYLYAYSPLKINFSVTNATCLYNNDATISSTVINGTPPYNYQWSTNQNSNNIGNLKTGKYFVTVTDANGCVGHDAVFVDYDKTNNSCYCSVTGRVYHDVNNNCQLDNNETGIQNIQIGIDNVGYTYSDVNGNYSFALPNGSFRLRESIRNQYPLASCAPVLFDFISNSGNNCVIEHNLAHSIDPLHDMSVQLWSVDKPVAGYEYNQQMIITNMGTIDEPLVTGRHHTDVQLPIVNVVSGMLSPLVGENFTTQNLPTLKPGQFQIIDINYPVSSTIPLGSELIFYDSCAYKTPIENWETDYSPANNVVIKRDQVVGSFDPNFIEVLPQGKGIDGIISREIEDLDYMVHFQNEGTWYAQQVEVVVDIDPNIDIKSIVPVASSHSPTSIKINNDRELVYSFKGIKLEPKIWNNSKSQGMFSFQCKLKDGLPEGTKISNKANIYFDFNLPVPTNFTLNTIEMKSKINEIQEEKEINISPNPASDVITLTIPKANQEEYIFYEVYNANGKLIHSQSNSEISISTWSNGLYIITSTMKSGTYVGKFIKI
jgi:Secretion system C-terminal sorting domain/SprB repeat